MNQWSVSDNQIRPIISVVIPVYNSERYLRECLISILGQTLRNIEVICVDDGSTDDSMKILLDLSRQDSRIRVISQPHSNAGAARNLGLQYAQGEYLSFLDSDDFFESSMLEIAYQKALEDCSDIVVFRCNLYLDGKKRYQDAAWSIRKDCLPDKAPFSLTDVRSNALQLFNGWAWDKLFRAAFVKAHNLQFQEQRTTNDLLFVQSALVLAEKISTIDEILVHQRVNQMTSLNVTREESWECFFQALVSFKSFLIHHNLYAYYQRDFVNLSLHIALWNLKTLKYPTQELCFNFLKEKGFSELGILEHERAYYYSNTEFLQLNRILMNSYKVVFPLGKKAYEARTNPYGASRLFKIRLFIYNGIECCKENGFKYTIITFLQSRFFHDQ